MVATKKLSIDDTFEAKKSANLRERTVRRRGAGGPDHKVQAEMTKWPLAMVSLSVSGLLSTVNRLKHLKATRSKSTLSAGDLR